MKIEKVQVFGFEAAVRGMRNPKNSWHHSDSVLNFCPFDAKYNPISDETNIESFYLGPKDEKLARNLVVGGPEHRKVLRQIMIWCDITAPRYFWVDLDTYKISTVKDSCSTMHTLGDRDLVQDDFEQPISDFHLTGLNSLGTFFRAAKRRKDVDDIRKVRRLYKNNLPEGFLQKATYMLSYEAALSIYLQRKNHGLLEFTDHLCQMIRGLPYMHIFIAAAEKARKKRLQLPRFLNLPKDVLLYNGGTLCDAATGHCSCGANHSLDEERITKEILLKILRENNL